jgi:hypothetical protein
MADSTIATRDVESWIRNEFLPKKYSQAFAKRKLGVQSGGEFECDAVSEDGMIVCFISTSSSTTAGGNPGADELAKIRKDAFWAGSLSEKPQEIVFACTDKSMVELIKQEKRMDASQSTLRRFLSSYP